MKYHIQLFFLFGFFSLTAQNILLEYNLIENLKFKVFTEKESKHYKISKLKDFKQDTPENVALSSFFAYSNEIVSELYFDKKNYSFVEDSSFDGIKEINQNDAYIQLHHKTNYIFEGEEMAYIMFTAKIKNVEFPFPTLLSLIKKDDKWYLHKRPNQQKLTKSLKMLKPCVLSNLIEGFSSDNDIKDLISRTKSQEGGVDFIKLFDQLVIIKKDKSLFSKLTMSQNANCSEINFKENVIGKSTLTGIIKNANIKVFKKQDSILISKIKKNNDSIILKSRLDIDFSNKQYSMLKFYRVIPNGEIKKEYIRLDNNILESPVRELLFLYENLNSEIFKELSPHIEENLITETELYKKTRGVYDVLNVNKMFDLYQKEKTLFSKYFYE